MSRHAMQRRLTRLVQQAPQVTARRLITICPDEWPTAIRDAYDAACASGDLVRQADLIERQTGERPVLGGPGTGLIRDHPVVSVIELRMR